MQSPWHQGYHKHLKSWKNAGIPGSQESKLGYGEIKDKEVGRGHMSFHAHDMTVGLYP